MFFFASFQKILVSEGKLRCHRDGELIVTEEKFATHEASVGECTLCWSHRLASEMLFCAGVCDDCWLRCVGEENREFSREVKLFRGERWRASWKICFSRSVFTPTSPWKSTLTSSFPPKSSSNRSSPHRHHQVTNCKTLSIHSAQRTSQR